MLPQPGASRALVSMTPGRIFSMPAKSRPLSAMSSMFSRVMSPERAPLLRLDERRFADDAHRLLEGADLERDGAKRHAFGRADDDALLFVALETLDADGEVERSGEQVGKHERAVGAGDGLFDEIRADVLDGDGGARHHAAARVGDDARQIGRQALGIRTCGRSGDDHRQRKHRA